MAYQNVGTPRFYIDHVNYLKSLGAFAHSGSITAEYRDSLYGLKSPSPIPHSEGGGGFAFNSSIINDEINWAGVLGHNLNSLGIRWYLEGYDGSYISIDNRASLINSTHSQNDLDGFGITIASPTNNPDGFNFSRPPQKIRFYFNSDGNLGYTPTDNLQIGCLCYGKYYDMPHSPDLNLKMSIEMDGIKTVKTKGGASLTNIKYSKPQDWGSQGAWQLEGGTNFRSGRREWDLSFSYLSDTDIMPLLGVQNYELDGSNNPVVTEDILDGTDFFSQVINRTMGGHLPFIFQPDNENSNPDQFAICRFDMDSFSYDQVAHNVYNVKLKIREVW